MRMRMTLPVPEGTSLECSSLVPLPRRQMDWVLRVMTAGLAPHEILGPLELAPSETEAGWPALVVEAAVSSGARRVGAFYAILEHGAHALATVADPARCDLAALRRALLAAAPENDDRVLSVDGFFAAARVRC
jgi:hypothetical protein